MKEHEYSKKRFTIRFSEPEQMYLLCKVNIWRDKDGHDDSEGRT